MRRGKRLWLALGLLASIPATAGTPVWAIRGEHNTVYLGGSVHLLKSTDASLPAAFNRAYSDAERLVMEIDLSHVDPMEAAGLMMERGMLPQDTTLKDELGVERYNRVSAAAAELGLPAELLDRMKPWVLGMQMLELKYMQLGFDPQQGVEQQLLQRALADKKEVQGLETLGEQLGAFDQLSDEEQAKFLDLVVTEMHEVEGETQKIVAAWRAGDTPKLARELGEEYDRFPALYRALVTDRNKRWLPQIQRLLSESQDYFVVVGALHLVGEDGLLDLLRKAGATPQALN